MDRKYSWKKTEDIEIDLADLLLRLCRQWKRIIICALVSAVLFGGYAWLKGKSSFESGETDMTETVELTKAEEQEVMDAVQLKDEITGLETYLNSSVLMQLDPYHKNKFVLLYRVDGAKRRALQGITESYLNFIINGGAVDAMMESGDCGITDESCLTELISAYQRTYNSPYQMIVDDVTDDSMLSDSLFYVEITGENAGSAQKMARVMQRVLEEYSAEVKERAGKHGLILVSSAESITADSGLQSQQHDKKALLSSNKTNLKTMTAAFSKKQLEVYKGYTGTEEGKEELEEIVSDEDSVFSIKYILLGFLGGIFAYGCIYACWYLFSDTVKSACEIKRIYAVPFYGEIPLKGADKKYGRKVSRVKQGTWEQGQAQVLSRIKLACKNQGITGLYAVSDLAFDIQEKECLDSMAVQLKKWGIDMTAVENTGVNIDMWDDLSGAVNVLTVCRISVTTHQIIDDAMTFYLENGMHVMGTIAFSQNV